MSDRPGAGWRAIDWRGPGGGRASATAGRGDDDGAPSDGATVIDLTGVEREGLHIDLDAVDVTDDDLDAADDDLDVPEDAEVPGEREHLAAYGDLEDLIDGFIEAYNAHDLDAVLECLASDCELPGLGEERDGFARACDELWDRRPNALLTRGRIGDEPVAVLWDVSDVDGVTGRAWDRVAVLTFDRDDAGEALGLVEPVEDAAFLESAEAPEPDADLVEGARWAEWYEGADGS